MRRARILAVVGMVTVLTAPMIAIGGAGAAATSTRTCTTPRSRAANVDTICDAGGTNFETTIAVNPTNPRNIVGAAIDLIRPPGGGFGSLVTHPHVSFDVGKSWTTYDLDYGQGNAAVDPSVAVTVDPATGGRTGGPYLIGQAYDGLNEHHYPASVGGSQTVHDSQFNLDGEGNVIGDQTDRRGLHLAIVWYDDRNAPHPVDSDPYKSITDADIVVSQTYDGGQTWSAPIALARPNDQFMPWAAYDAHGLLQVGFFDRAYDPDNHKYGFTLASEKAPGSLTFSFKKVSTALSDPTRDNLASRGTINPAFPFPAVSIGDYPGLAVGPDAVVAYWTDLRNDACAGGRCGHRQDSYFASIPNP